VSSSSRARQARISSRFGTAFNAAYPDIEVQFSGGAGAAEIPKVIRERQAGIYAWDV
jgi:hypothetical protein